MSEKNPQPAGGGRPKPGEWMWAVMPVNAGIQGFSTLAPLYILHLGGSVVDVALFTTLYNFVLIPAAIVWGRLTDRLGKRRIFFIVACAGSTFVFLVMYLLPSLGALAALYGVLAVVVGAASTATNLLVMETGAKKSWMSAYARLSLITNLGSGLGLAVGFLWTSVLPVGAFLLFCSFSAGASFLLSYRLIFEPAVPLESSQLSIHPLGYFSRIYHGVTSAFEQLVISPPSPSDVVRLLRATRAGAMTGRALLFLSTFIFTTASGLLNTSFTPFLVDSGVVDNEVFAISLVNVIIQTGAYRVVGPMINRFGGVRVGSYALLLRTILYMTFAVAALAFRGTALFIVATLVFALVGFAYTFWNSATSVMLFSNLGQEKQGNLLGGYAALSALGTVLGSLFTGYISLDLGYSTTFSMAAALMLVAFFVLEASLKSLGYLESDQGEPRAQI